MYLSAPLQCSWLLWYYVLKIILGNLFCYKSNLLFSWAHTCKLVCDMYGAGLWGRWKQKGLRFYPRLACSGRNKQSTVSLSLAAPPVPRPELVILSQKTSRKPLDHSPHLQNDPQSFSATLSSQSPSSNLHPKSLKRPIMGCFRGQGY